MNHGESDYAAAYREGYNTALDRCGYKEPEE